MTVVRGRPSKRKEAEIFAENGTTLAEIFELDPIRQPIDPQFEPYYNQMLRGKPAAIIQYCDEHWEQGKLSPSFFEIVGRLCVLRYYNIAETILRNIERRRVTGWPSKKRTYRYWFAKLQPLCKDTRRFIDIELKSNPSVRRDRLWEKYLEQPKWDIRSQQGADHHRVRQEAIRELLQGSTAAAERSLIALVNAFGSFKLVPREIFNELASTKYVSGRRTFRLKPSDVVAKYVCKITGISKSTATH